MTTHCIKFTSADIEPARGVDYCPLTFRDHGFNANLGKAANQDDLSLQAVTPWSPKDAV